MRKKRLWFVAVGLIVSFVLSLIFEKIEVYANETQGTFSDIFENNAYTDNIKDFCGNGYNIEFDVMNNWNDGHIINIKIRNTGNDKIENWRLKIGYENIINIWNASIDKYENGLYYISNVGYNRTINPGGFVEFGFQVNNTFIDFPNEINLLNNNSNIISSNNYTVEYIVNNDWGTGFNSIIKINNISSDVIKNWHLSFKFNRIINDIWNSEIERQEGSFYCLKHSDYNADILPGETIYLGFNGIAGSTTDLPSDFVLVGDQIGSQNTDKNQSNFIQDEDIIIDQIETNELKTAYDALDIIYTGNDFPFSITENIGLINEINGFQVKWKSSNTEYINNNGIVNRPKEESEIVYLYAVIGNEKESIEKEFKLKVIKDKYETFNYSDIFHIEELIQLFKYNTNPEDLDIYINKNDIIDLLYGAISDFKVETPKEALLALYGIKDFLGIDSFEQDIRFDSVSLCNEYIKYRFVQNYKGIPVDGAFITLLTDLDGNTFMLNNKMYNIDIDIDPQVNLEEAKEIVKLSEEGKGNVIDGSLIIVPWNERTYLAWNIVYEENSSVYNIYVNTQNGIIEYSNKYMASVLTGAFKNETGWTCFANYEEKKGKPQLIDTERRLFVTEKKDERELLTAIYPDEAIVKENDEENKKTWARAISAYNEVCKVYDYYKAKWGIQDISGINKNIALVINIEKCNPEIGKTESYNNQAAYYYEENVFGFGNEEHEIYGWISMANSPIVVAHEYTHAVVNIVSPELCRGQYKKESSAINEGYADVMGMLIANSDDWSIKTLAGRVIRDCKENIDYSSLPTTENPALYVSDVLADYGHNNGIVLSKACYYMLQHGITKEQLENIIMKSLIPEYSVDATFIDVRRMIRNTVKKEYQGNNDIMNIVENAFDEVGLIDEAEKRLTAKTYINFLNGKVVAASKDDTPNNYKGLSGVSISLVPLNGIGTIKYINSDNNGCFTLKTWKNSDKLESGDYKIVFQKKGYISYETQIRIEEDKDYFLEKIALLPEDYNSIGTIHGYIIDSETGIGVKGLYIRIYNDKGSLISSCVSQDNGYYSSESLASGYYKITVKDQRTYSSVGGKENTYMGIEKSIVLTDYLNYNGVNILIIPKKDVGQASIVLEWGNSPRDLDSHLIGYRIVDGMNYYEAAFEVCYYDKTYIVNDDVKVKLDIDDTDGFGPETITINNLDKAKYVYYVHKFSSDGRLADSNAVVKITLYEQGSKINQYTFTVPPDGEGQYWSVFAIYSNVEDGKVTIESINNISNFVPVG